MTTSCPHRENARINASVPGALAAEQAGGAQGKRTRFVNASGASTDIPTAAANARPSAAQNVR